MQQKKVSGIVKLYENSFQNSNTQASIAKGFVGFYLTSFVFAM